MRVGPAGAERAVVLDDEGGAWSLSGITEEIDGAFLSSGGIDRSESALAAGSLEPVAIGGARIGAPIARPQAVICIGQNYAAHAAESGDSPPSVPILFFKHPNTIVGPCDDIELPPHAEKVDWEVELGIVIGKPAYRLASEEAAADAIAGYVVSHDVSERDWQVRDSGGQWSKGKSAPTFNPLGPWLVPARDIPDVQQLRLRSFVNGEPRQDSSTADMVFSVTEIIHHVSQYMALEPGDLINTGTPQGVALSGRFPYLGAGDVVELEIDGLGGQRQRTVRAHGA
jgi:2-keto-4-pentenoate hydratase/2-oxohepta-3-ene-1,7-dioic acid hydratase in catechol pathway